MEIRLSFPNGHNYLFDEIEYDPVTTSLDAYIMRAQTWAVQLGSKTYRAKSGRWWTNAVTDTTIFLIDMEEA